MSTNLVVNLDEIAIDLETSVAFLKQNKLKFTEIRLINSKNIMLLSLTEVRQLKALLDLNNIKVAAIASPLFKWFIDKPIPGMKFDGFGFDPALDLSKKKKYIDKAMDIADILDTKLIRIFSNLSDGSIDPASFKVDPALKYALDKALSRDKYLLIENEPVCIINKKADILRLLKHFKNKRLKLWLDIANFYQQDEPLELEDIIELLPYTKYIHIKDYILDNTVKYVPVGQGIINYKRIFSDIKNVIALNSLKAPFISIETHVKGDKLNATKASVEYLRSIDTQPRIGYALIGAGRITRKHVEALKLNINSELRGVYDIKPRKGEILSKANDCHNYRSLEEALNDGSVKVITICTPHDTHLDLVNKAIAAGKKVLCEKPLFINYQDALAYSTNKKFQDNTFVVFQYIYNKAVKTLFELLNREVLVRSLPFLLTCAGGEMTNIYLTGTAA